MRMMRWRRRRREEEGEEEEEEEEDLWSLKVAELKEKCREKGLAVGGTHRVWSRDCKRWRRRRR